MSVSSVSKELRYVSRSLGEARGDESGQYRGKSVYRVVEEIDLRGGRFQY